MKKLCSCMDCQALKHDTTSASQDTSYICFKHASPVDSSLQSWLQALDYIETLDFISKTSLEPVSFAAPLTHIHGRQSPKTAQHGSMSSSREQNRWKITDIKEQSALLCSLPNLPFNINVPSSSTPLTTLNTSITAKWFNHQLQINCSV